jgi:3-methyladenine DNA glycosylase AlkD
MFINSLRGGGGGCCCLLNLILLSTKLAAVWSLRVGVTLPRQSGLSSCQRLFATLPVNSPLTFSMTKTITTAKELQRLVRSSKKLKPAGVERFFKTGKGDYGEGDKFLGLRMPDLRLVAKAHKEMILTEVEQLLWSEYNDERCLGLVILCEKFKQADELARTAIVDVYLRNTQWVNNWNLVDVSCYFLLGEYLLTKQDRSILYRLADSASLWERRIAVVSTMAFLRKGEYTDTFAIADKLLSDPEDLIHKAVGWLVKEVGKRDEAQLVAYLDSRAAAMPRTMLRVAVEKLSKLQRNKYLAMIPSNTVNQPAK